jgi:hypothetical protein
MMFKSREKKEWKELKLESENSLLYKLQKILVALEATIASHLVVFMETLEKVGSVKTKENLEDLVVSFFLSFLHVTIVSSDCRTT